MSSYKRTWKSEKPSIRHNRGEHYVAFVRRKTANRSLVDPKKLVYDLALLNDGTPHHTICDVIVEQYRLARDEGDSRWIEATRREAATILCSERWVDENLPSLSRKPRPLRKRRPPSATVSSATSSAMCVDIRLLSNPDLEVVRENAMEPSEPYVAEEKSTVMEEANEDDVSEVHEVAESSVTHDTADCECSEVHDTAEFSVVHDTADQDHHKPTTVSRPFKSILPVKSSGSYSARRVQTDIKETEQSAKRPRLDPELKVTVDLHNVNHPFFQRCPFPDCGRKERKVKRHVQRSHLPKLFNDIRPLRYLDESTLSQLQVAALQSLVRSVLGPDADLLSGVDYVNRSGMLTPDTTLHPDTLVFMRRLCAHQGWLEPPEGFTLSPLNSPATLFHWRCLVVLMSPLQPMQREEFRTHGRVTGGITSTLDTKETQVPVVDSSTEDEFTVIDVSYGSDVDIPIEPLPVTQSDPCIVQELCSPQTSTVLEAFDSHFHLDRTCSRIWRCSSGRSVEDLLSHSYSSDLRPNLEVTVSGGVVIYSEPSTHPESVDMCGPWRMAIGVHPKHVEELTPDRFLHLKNMLNSPYVVALGEIGLDRTVPVKLWRRQDEVFRQVLTLTRKDKVLVLHLRGIAADRIGMDVHARCIQLLRKSCDPDQPIHLHCFMGDPELVKEWLDCCSNVYFGFTGAVTNFSADQVAGLQSVPMSRLLLETDSPYMKPGGGAVNTPAFIGDVATEVASKLQVSVQYLLKETVKNSRRLYQF
ncbi:uncharacterized protein LOC134271630 [Saccostrea cucullata]|uniref:uncharacterized protein LOC134271630 n=1 Tax=Saccostrea cuccullata TaxID=36930 RepID=UPI002ED17D78